MCRYETGKQNARQSIQEATDVHAAKTKDFEKILHQATVFEFPELLNEAGCILRTIGDNLKHAINLWDFIDTFEECVVASRGAVLRAGWNAGLVMMMTAMMMMVVVVVVVVVMMMVVVVMIMVVMMMTRRRRMMMMMVVLVVMMVVVMMVTMMVVMMVMMMVM